MTDNVVSFSHSPFTLLYNGKTLERSFVQYRFGFFKAALFIAAVVEFIAVLSNYFVGLAEYIWFVAGATLTLFMLAFVATASAVILVIFSFKRFYEFASKHRSFFAHLYELLSVGVALTFVIRCAANYAFLEACQRENSAIQQTTPEERYNFCVRAITPYTYLLLVPAFFMGQPRFFIFGFITLAGVVSCYSIRFVLPVDTLSEMLIKLLYDLVLFPVVVACYRVLEKIYRTNFEAAQLANYEINAILVMKDQALSCLQRLLPQVVFSKLTSMAKEPVTFEPLATVYVGQVYNFSSWWFQKLPAESVRLTLGFHYEIEKVLSCYPSLYKMDSMGDEFVVIGNVLEADDKRHVQNMCLFAGRVSQISVNIGMYHASEMPWHASIHMGPLFGGLFGCKYQILGKALTACRQHLSSSQPGETVVSECVCEAYCDRKGGIEEQQCSFFPLQSSQEQTQANDLFLLRFRDFGPSMPSFNPLSTTAQTGETDGRDDRKEATNPQRNRAETPDLAQIKLLVQRLENRMLLAPPAGAAKLTATTTTGGDRNEDMITTPSSVEAVSTEQLRTSDIDMNLRSRREDSVEGALGGGLFGEAHTEGEETEGLIIGSDAYSMIRSGCNMRFRSDSIEELYTAFPKIEATVVSRFSQVISFAAFACLTTVEAFWVDDNSSWGPKLIAGVSLMALAACTSLGNLLLTIGRKENRPIRIIEIFLLFFSLESAILGVFLSRPSTVGNHPFFLLFVLGIMLHLELLHLRWWAGVSCCIAAVWLPVLGYNAIFSGFWKLGDIVLLPVFLLSSTGLAFSLEVHSRLTFLHKHLLKIRQEEGKATQEFLCRALEVTVPKTYLEAAVTATSDRNACGADVYRIPRSTVISILAPTALLEVNRSADEVKELFLSLNGFYLEILAAQEKMLGVFETLSFAGDCVFVAGPLAEKNEVAIEVGVIKAMHFLSYLPHHTAVVCLDELIVTLSPRGGSLFNVFGRSITEARALIHAVPEGSKVVTSAYYTAYRPYVGLRSSPSSPTGSAMCDSEVVFTDPMVWRIRGLGAVEVRNLHFLR